MLDWNSSAMFESTSHNDTLKKEGVAIIDHFYSIQGNKLFWKNKGKFDSIYLEFPIWTAPYDNWKVDK